MRVGCGLPVTSMALLVGVVHVIDADWSELGYQ